MNPELFLHLVVMTGVNILFFPIRVSNFKPKLIKTNLNLTQKCTLPCQISSNTDDIFNIEESSNIIYY